MTITLLLIVGAILFFILKKKPRKESNDSITQQIKNYIKKMTKESNNVTIRIGDSSNDIDDTIIDVTGQSFKIQNIKNLTKYENGVPFWAHKYIYSHSDLLYASYSQQKFYELFKKYFLEEVYLDLEGNTNYAFVLLFDLLNDYGNHKNLEILEEQLNELGQHYQKTKPYCNSLFSKVLRSEGGNINSINEDYFGVPFSKYHNDDQLFWKLGNKYKSKLDLCDDDIKLLNSLPNQDTNFCSIEFCQIEVIKLFLIAIKELRSNFDLQNKTLDNEMNSVADVVVRKNFRFRVGSSNYKYAIEQAITDFYLVIFKYCENTVREAFDHKRKLNCSLPYNNEEGKLEFETKIMQKLEELVSKQIQTIKSPDENTEIELNAQTTTRWKSKFEYLKTNYNKNPQKFLDSIINLGRLNAKNPSVEKIFFEASRAMASQHKIISLTLYIHYLYHDLKSATFDNRKLTKTIQKSLFSSKDELHVFESIVSELIKDKNHEKAIKALPRIYEVKRKKIELNDSEIRKVQQKHSGTVNLLNEYLQDDNEDVNTSIQSQEINNQELSISIIQKNKNPETSIFSDKIVLSDIQISALEMFPKYNFIVPQNDVEEFAKSKGVFKNLIIESINESCYDVLDDLLIEEDEEYYTMDPDYYKKLRSND